jgi:hypothetical protein
VVLLELLPLQVAIDDNQVFFEHLVCVGDLNPTNVHLTTDLVVDEILQQFNQELIVEVLAAFGAHKLGIYLELLQEHLQTVPYLIDMRWTYTDCTRFWSLI